MDQTLVIELIERSRKNDTRAFRQLVEAHQGMIYSVAFRMLCDENEAKDVVQDTFIKLWMNLSQFNADKKLSTWLYSIATNLCLDQLKSSRRKHSLNIPVDELLDYCNGNDFEEDFLGKETARVILTLTNELTPKQKLVFTLRYLEEMEVTEIVEITGLSAGKIKSNLYLARQTIVKKLENY